MYDEDFFPPTREVIQIQSGRCALCCCLPPLQLCSILDDSEKSSYENKFDLGIVWHLIPQDFSRTSGSNGIPLCPTCHSLYRSGYESWESPICFSPCTEILQYLEKCIPELDATNVDEILHDLRSNPPETEAAKKAKPFLDCFEIYLLEYPPDREQCIATQFLPSPCKLDATGSSFIPTDTITPGSTFRIFEAQAIPSSSTTPTSLANISLSAPHINFHTDQSRLLWRLEGWSAGAFMAVLVQLAFPWAIKPKSTSLKRALDRFFIKTTLRRNPVLARRMTDVLIRSRREDCCS